MEGLPEGLPRASCRPGSSISNADTTRPPKTAQTTSPGEATPSPMTSARSLNVASAADLLPARTSGQLAGV